MIISVIYLLEWKRENIKERTEPGICLKMYLIRFHVQMQLIRRESNGKCYWTRDGRNDGGWGGNLMYHARPYTIEVEEQKIPWQSLLIEGVEMFTFEWAYQMLQRQRTNVRTRERVREMEWKYYRHSERPRHRMRDKKTERLRRRQTKHRGRESERDWWKLVFSNDKYDNDTICVWWNLTKHVEINTRFF